MFRFFKELYLTGFTLGFRVSGSSWSPRMNAGKGVAAVAFIEGLTLVSVVAWIEIYVETRFLLNAGKWTMGMVFLALYYANYYLLVTRGHGIKFEPEFSHLEKSRKTILVIGFVVALLAAVAFFYYSISAYQQFFHIIPKKGF